MMTIRSSILPIVVAVPLALQAQAASAQAARNVAGQQYTPSTPQSLDKNFSLPSYGMPGSELPQQRTMATPDASSRRPSFYGSDTDGGGDGVSGQASFYGPDTDGSTDLLPSKQARLPQDMETPLFTTHGDTTDSGEEKPDLADRRDQTQ